MVGRRSDGYFSKVQFFEGETAFGRVGCRFPLTSSLHLTIRGKRTSSVLLRPFREGATLELPL